MPPEPTQAEKIVGLENTIGAMARKLDGALAAGLVARAQARADAADDAVNSQSRRVAGNPTTRRSAELMLGASSIVGV
jgi:hypothetical protein